MDILFITWSLSKFLTEPNLSPTLTAIRFHILQYKMVSGSVCQLLWHQTLRNWIRVYSVCIKKKTGFFFYKTMMKIKTESDTQKCLAYRLKISVDDKLTVSLLFFPENRLWHFSLRKQFAWIVKACFLGKTRKTYHQFVVCWICPTSGKG